MIVGLMFEISGRLSIKLLFEFIVPPTPTPIGPCPVSVVGFSLPRGALWDSKIKLPTVGPSLES